MGSTGRARRRRGSAILAPGGAVGGGVAAGRQRTGGLVVAGLVLALGIFVVDPILIAVIVLPGSILIQRVGWGEHEPQCGRSAGVRRGVRLPLPCRMVRGPHLDGSCVGSSGTRPSCSWWWRRTPSRVTSSSGSTGSPTWPAARSSDGSSATGAGPASPTESICGVRPHSRCWPSSTRPPGVPPGPVGRVPEERGRRGHVGRGGRRPAQPTLGGDREGRGPDHRGALPARTRRLAVAPGRHPAGDRPRDRFPDQFPRAGAASSRSSSSSVPGAALVYYSRPS